MPRLVPPSIPDGALCSSEQPTLLMGGGFHLRPWTIHDRDMLVAAFADPAIQRWHLQRLDSPEEAERWIRAAGEGWQAETAASWAIADVASDVAVGRAALYFHDLRNGLGEVTYWVVPESRGHGLATRAVEAVCSWAFEVAGFHRIELAHSVDNPASCRVAERAGFLAEGTRRQALRHEDGWHDMHVHSRLETHAPSCGAAPEWDGIERASWRCLRLTSPSKWG